MAFPILLQDGVLVLPLKQALDRLVPGILQDTPEILDPVKAFDDLRHSVSAAHPTQFVLGGFGATGLPSHFHHEDVRTIRARVYEAVYPVFAHLFPGRHVEALFDRLSIRRMGTTIGAESWHRDVGQKEQGDIIYGGWVNLDPPGTSPQQFSCVPGDVLPPDVDPFGFSKFDKKDYPQLNQAFKASGGPISIPPGHVILFDQTIAHKITGAKAKRTSLRLYMGWRITTSTIPLYDKAAIITAQAVPPLPSGQAIPMYAKLHWVNWKDRLQAFSSGFKPECLDSKRPGVVARELPSLTALGLGFRAYTPSEAAIFYPQRLVPIEQAEEVVERPAKKQKS